MCTLLRDTPKTYSLDIVFVQILQTTATTRARDIFICAAREYAHVQIHAGTGKRGWVIPPEIRRGSARIYTYIIYTHTQIHVIQATKFENKDEKGLRNRILFN